MYATDPVADMLTRVRNASTAGLRYAMVPASKLKIEVTKILETEGFVRGFRLIRDNGQGKIKIAIKYDEHGEPVIHGLVRVSKPGRRVYAGVDKLPNVRGGLGKAILSTPKGVLTCDQARGSRVGGEVLAYVW
jgi:small subunit ribosomal protein S8